MDLILMLKSLQPIIMKYQIDKKPSNNNLLKENVVMKPVLFITELEDKIPNYSKVELF